jgi:TolA-binding protein
MNKQNQPIRVLTKLEDEIRDLREEIKRLKATVQTFKPQGCTCVNEPRDNYYCPHHGCGHANKYAEMEAVRAMKPWDL